MEETLGKGTAFQSDIFLNTFEGRHASLALDTERLIGFGVS